MLFSPPPSSSLLLTYQKRRQLYLIFENIKFDSLVIYCFEFPVWHSIVRDCRIAARFLPSGEMLNFSRKRGAYFCGMSTVSSNGVYYTYSGKGQEDAPCQQSDGAHRRQSFLRAQTRLCYFIISLSRLGRHPSPPWYTFFNYLQ